MNPPIQIRPERADHEQVAPLLAALDAYLATLYAPEDNYILDVQALLQPDVDFVVAAEGASLVGCGATRRMPGEPDTAGQGYGEVKRMFVHPQWRGRRIAEQVLSVLEQRLLADGLDLALLETGRDQLEAIRLYERFGYERRGPFGGYPDNGLSVFYQKRLTGRDQP